MAWMDDYLALLRIQYPCYVLLIKHGTWYNVYDQDADVMRRILNWNVVSRDGHQVTGGPVLDNITNALRKNGFAYKIISGAKVIGSYDPPDQNPALTEALSLPKNVVRIGSKVIVDIDGDEETYEICEEGNIIENKISYQAPIGVALLGHKCGDTVCAYVPAGTLMMKILKLEQAQEG